MLDLGNGQLAAADDFAEDDIQEDDSSADEDESLADEDESSGDGLDEDMDSEEAAAAAAAGQDGCSEEDEGEEEPQPAKVRVGRSVGYCCVLIGVVGSNCEVQLVWGTMVCTAAVHIAGRQYSVGEVGTLV
jgi:hypothetical protein